MTGVDIVGELLRANAPLVAKVPLANIKAGALPENAPLPALLLRTVSRVERQRLKRGTMVRYVERVAVAVRAATYREQVAIMKMVLPICAGFTGSLGTATNIAINSAGTGPDLIGPGNTFEQTQDFRVGFDDPA
jgi:hypothetical protein